MTSPFVGCFKGTAGGWLETVTGKEFSIAEPTAKMVDVADIAHALSHLCRFGGHSKTFYSVGQHSVYAYKVAEDYYPKDKNLQMAVLLHDGSEAYTTDLIRPLKLMLPEFCAIEAKIQACIYKALGIHCGEAEEEAIKLIDNNLLRLEAEHLLQSKGEKFDFDGVQQLKFSFGIQPWTAVTARRQFLRAYYGAGPVNR